jgi:RNA polymerase sigma-70 factor (ECF subfamily)
LQPSNCRLLDAREVAFAGVGDSKSPTLVLGFESADHPLDAWMARLADGDRSAFDGVFERLQGPLNRLCLGFLGNEADAADATQEALQKVLERASDYDPARRALPWALALAGWECRTVARRRQRRREVPEAEAGVRPGADEEEAFAQRKLVEAAMAVMGTLSEQDRETLTATFWEEAGPVAGATFRKRRERALTRLRQAFWRIHGLG